MSSNINSHDPTVTPHHTDILAGVNLGNFSALLGNFSIFLTKDYKKCSIKNHILCKKCICHIVRNKWTFNLYEFEMESDKDVAVKYRNTARNNGDHQSSIVWSTDFHFIYIWLCYSLLCAKFWSCHLNMVNKTKFPCSENTGH